MYFIKAEKLLNSSIVGEKHMTPPSNFQDISVTSREAVGAWCVRCYKFGGNECRVAGTAAQQRNTYKSEPTRLQKSRD